MAVVSLLHFDSIVDLLLERTAGDLYPRNILNRIGEVSPTKQIRLAGNHLTMADIPDPATAPEQLSQRQRHDISLPLTGAVFDLLVEVFQQNLVDTGLITVQLDSISRRMQSDGHQLEDVHTNFRLAYEANKIGFKQALTDARDYLGWLLAYCWRGLTPELHFSEVLRLLLEADKVLARGHYQIEIASVFASRGIFLSLDNRAL